MKRILAAQFLMVAALVAQANPWWDNPILMGSVTFGGQKGDGGPYHVGVDAGETYLAAPQSMAIDPVSLFTWDDAANGSFGTPVNIISNSLLAALHSNSQIRGAAISTRHGKMLVGNYNVPYILSVPLEPVEPVLDDGVAQDPNVFVIENDLGIKLDSFFFSNDGRYLYSSSLNSAYRNKVVKYQVGDLGKSGVQLEAVDGCVYDFGARVRNAAFATIDGRTLYYALLDGTNGVKVLDVDTGDISTIVSPSPTDATYGAIAIAGVARHEPRLYLLPCRANRITDDMTIYQLDPTGRTLAGDGSPQVFSRGELESLAGFELTGENGIDVTVSDDESVLILSAKSKMASIRHHPEVRVFNVGGKAQVQVNQSGRILPGTDIRCRLTNLSRRFKAYAYIDGKEAEIDPNGYFSGFAGASADIVVTYAWKDSWYMDPTLKNKVVVDGSSTYSPWGGFLDEKNGHYFATLSCSHFGGGESGLVQIDARSLLKWRRENQQAVNWTSHSFESGQETFRDLSFSPEFGVVLSSGFCGDTNKVVAYPLGGSWTNDQDRYFVTNDLGRRLWPSAFGTGSEYFYAVHSTRGTEPTGDWINDTIAPALGRFRPVADQSGKLLSFTFVDDIVTNNLPHIGDYACYVGVVRTYRDANGREIIYVAGQDGVTAIDLSTTPPTVVRNWFKNVGKYDETYPSLNIIGEAMGTPHLVLNRSTTGLSVYPLREDLMTLASTDPIAAYRKSDSPFSSYGLEGNAMAFCGFGATADEKAIYFSAPTDGIKFTTLLITSQRVKNSNPETMIIMR
jgi:hypothetical protein